MLRKRLYVYVLVVLYILNSGCAAVVVGAGAGAAGAIWYKGKLEETVAASVPNVHQAVRAGLKDLNITITEDRHDGLTAEVRAVLADGKKVWIDAESVGASTTKLTIRVGVFGDKDFSLRIRDAIKRHL
jgi:uncharacterized protein (UPF0333 family)